MGLPHKISAPGGDPIVKPTQFPQHYTPHTPMCHPRPFTEDTAAMHVCAYAPTRIRGPVKR